MRYYEREHFGAYARINTEGLQQWSDLVRTLRLAARAEATSSGHLEQLRCRSHGAVLRAIRLHNVHRTGDLSASRLSVQDEGLAPGLVVGRSSCGDGPDASHGCAVEAVGVRRYEHVVGSSVARSVRLNGGYRN